MRFLQSFNWLSVVSVLITIGAVTCAVLSQSLGVAALTLGLAAIVMALLVIADTRSE